MKKTLFDRTYEHYLKTSKKTDRPKTKSGKRHKVPQLNQRRTWLETHKEFLRWKKTDGFPKWRKKQFLKQGGTCYYCDEPLMGVKQNIEHIIPKIRGGSNSKNNLVIACWKCNKEKYTDMLSVNKRKALQSKNKKKKGTFHLLKETMLTEEEVGYRLGEMFREE